MREAGLDPDAFLARPVADARLASVVRRLLVEADAIYARGRSGISALPAGCRPAIAAAASLYAEIGREVARREYDSVATRAVVSPARKAGALLRAATADAAQEFRHALPMDAIAFLVDAAIAVRPARTEARIAWWRLDARAARMVELCEILQRREQLGRKGG
jgi:15-cis-phytoene synthase